MTENLQIVNVNAPPNLPPDKTILYILRLEHSCFYVGISQNLPSRFRSHQKGTGALWTREHKPLSILFAWSIPSSLAPHEEGRLTARLVQRYGINRVRGGHLTRRAPYEGALLCGMLGAVSRNLMGQGRLPLRCGGCACFGHTEDVCELFPPGGRLLCRQNLAETGAACAREMRGVSGDGETAGRGEGSVVEVSAPRAGAGADGRDGSGEVRKCCARREAMGREGARRVVQEQARKRRGEDSVVEVSAQRAVRKGEGERADVGCSAPREGFVSVWDCDTALEQLVILD